MAKALNSKTLKVGEFVVHFSPATLHDMDTVHKTEEAAKNFIKKLADKQLHWFATISKVTDNFGCTCHPKAKRKQDKLKCY